MPPAKRDPASILDAIIERAPKLHAAGIRSLSFEGLSVELTPVMNPLADAFFNGPSGKGQGTDEELADLADKIREHEADPLNDRATYAGGRVPGFTRPKKEQP